MKSNIVFSAIFSVAAVVVTIAEPSVLEIGYVPPENIVEAQENLAGNVEAGMLAELLDQEDILPAPAPEVETKVEPKSEVKDEPIPEVKVEVAPTVEGNIESANNAEVAPTNNAEVAPTNNAEVAPTAEGNIESTDNAEVESTATIETEPKVEIATTVEGEVKTEVEGEEKAVTEVPESTAEQPQEPKVATAGDVKRPAKITSDSTIYNRKEGIAVFDGKVHLDDVQYQMYADKVFVFLDGTNDIKRLVAVGNVAMTNEMRMAYGTKASYTKKNGLVVLYGDDKIAAEVRDESKEDPQVVRGKKIRFWIDSEQVEVIDADISGPAPGNGEIGADQIKKALGK